MNWINIVKDGKYDEAAPLPKYNVPVLAKLEHWHTKRTIYAVLKRVNADDYDWEMEKIAVANCHMIGL